MKKVKSIDLSAFSFQWFFIINEKTFGFIDKRGNEVYIYERNNFEGTAYKELG